jgi:alpha-L-arabinofuranosidase
MRTKLTIYLSLLMGGFLQVSIGATTDTEEVRYRVYNRTISTVDARLFGSFLEHPQFESEHPQFDPENDGAKALIPGTGEFKPSIIDLFREMQIPIVRFPGGTCVDYSDWRDMISNVPGRGLDRPVSSANRNNKIDNNFGYDEFLQLSTQLGWEKIIVVNFRDGLLNRKSTEKAAQQAAGLVAYCNAPVGARLPAGMPDWPVVRKLNGHSDPYKVKYWQIGNETWLFQKKMQKPADNKADRDYADCVLAYVKAMLAVDPSIEFLVDGVNGGKLARKEMPDKIRHLVFHKYQPWNIREVQRDEKPVPVDTLSASDVWYAWVATPEFNDQGLAIMTDKLIPLARKQHFNVAVTEWNWLGWWDNLAGPSNSSMARGVGVAGFVHALMRDSDVIDIGCQSDLLGYGNSYHAIQVDPRGQYQPRYIPSGQVMALYSAHHGPRLLQTEGINVPTYPQPFSMGHIKSQACVAYLDTLATSDGRTLFLHVINRHFERDFTLAVDTEGFGRLGDKAQRYSLVGRLDATPDDSAQVGQITQTEFPCGKTGLTIQVPARSVSCIEIPLKGADVSTLKTTDAKPDAAVRLKKLQSLYDQGLINKDEYEKKKKEILESL